MKELMARLEALAEGLVDLSHPVPSPSTINYCLRRLWYQAHGIPVTDPVSLASVKRLRAGSAIEPFWHELFRRAGFQVFTLAGGTRIPIGDVMDGEPDALLRDPETGEWILLEIKDLGVWSWLDIYEQGLALGAPDYYDQVQLYLFALGLERAIFVAGIADPSALVWVWQRIKRYPGFPPDFLALEVRRDDAAIARALDRAVMVKQALQSQHPPMREHDPQLGKFPCGSEERPYCPWRQRCIREVE